MSVNAGCEAEYERRHNPIWGRSEAVLKSPAPTITPSFLNPQTRQLFRLMSSRGRKTLGGVDRCHTECSAVESAWAT